MRCKPCNKWSKIDFLAQWSLSYLQVLPLGLCTLIPLSLPFLKIVCRFSFGITINYLITFSCILPPSESYSLSAAILALETGRGIQIRTVGQLRDLYCVWFCHKNHVQVWRMCRCIVMVEGPVTTCHPPPASFFSSLYSSSCKELL